MQAAVVEDARLPRLAWIARVETSRGRATLTHGSRVERGDDWIVEGVWDGPFGNGFADSEHFFGSGVRVRDGAVVFVPSCAPVDRLVWAEVDGAIVASNSLALLLASTARRLRVEDGAARALYALKKGIDAYDDVIPTPSGPIHQLFYSNLEVTSASRTRRHKALPREIGSYEEYRGLLVQAVERLGRNLADPERRIPVRPLATISRGYDSPAVCALSRAAGLRTCYTCARSNSLIPRFLNRAATDDDGTVIARALGLETRMLVPDEAEELYFLAGSDEPEFPFGSMARDIEESEGTAAVFSGYYGDKIWRTNAFADERAPAIIRFDASGLSLGEIRLKAGFFNVPLPCLYARSLASIARISRSDAMRPWRTWTKYDRPIPRRVLTEAGVDGSLFGLRKKFIARRPLLPTSRILRQDFAESVSQQTAYSQRRVIGSARLDAAMTIPFAAAYRIAGIRRPSLVRPTDIQSRLYAWAVNRLASQYASSLPDRSPH